MEIQLFYIMLSFPFSVAHEGGERLTPLDLVAIEMESTIPVLLLMLLLLFAVPQKKKTIT